MAHAVELLAPVDPQRRVIGDHLVRADINGRVADAIVIIAGAALLAAAAQVRVPLPFTPVPLSGQTFAVLLVGAGLGLRRGALATALYLLIGLLGAPVFVGGGSGMGHLLGATGGYLVGFVVAAALLGWLAERRAERHFLPAAGAMAIATLAIYVFGVAGLMLVTGASVSQAIALGVLPFVFGDALKALLAAVLLPSTWAMIGRLDSSADR
jgi:biotin transport system substrate-specific component